MPKKFKIKIQPEAKQDLDEIYRYISRDSPHNARSFVRQLLKKILTLEIFPLRGSLCRMTKEGRLKEFRYLNYKKYLIFYEVHESEVYILHITAPGKNWIALFL